MKHFMQWLRPGLAIKRWMVLFSLGILLLVFGATLILNYQIFGIMEERMLRFAFQMTGSYSYTFLAVCGTLFVILGLWIMTTAVRKLMKRFVELLAPDQKEVSSSCPAWNSPGDRRWWPSAAAMACPCCSAA